MTTGANVVPSQPSISEAVAGNGRVTLNWSAASNATGYVIDYGTTSGSLTSQQSVGNVTYATVEALDNGTTYYFTVKGSNSAGAGLASAQASATPTIALGALYIEEVQYNVINQPTQIIYGNGVVSTYTYHALNYRLERLHSVDALGGAIQDFSYMYDGVGNMLSKADAITGVTETYQYDALGRLVAVNTSVIDYEDNGNIAQKDGEVYAYNATGSAHAVTSTTDGISYQYDVNGNMVQEDDNGSITDYTYDVENRLVQVVKGGSTIGEYTYDDTGERVAKTVSGITTHYVYPLYEQRGPEYVSYIMVQGQRVARIVNGTLEYLHPDHLGSTHVMTDSNGSVLSTMQHGPFGEVVGVAPSETQPGYTGQYYDAETGLYYYGARYYNPSLACFLTADWIIPNPFNAQSFNRYSYVANNPVNFVDPTGNVPLILSNAELDNQYIGNSLSGQYSLSDIPVYDVEGVRVGGVIGGNVDFGNNNQSFSFINNSTGVSLAEIGFCDSSCPRIRPREMSTFDSFSLGLGFMSGFKSISILRNIVGSIFSSKKSQDFERVVSEAELKVTEKTGLLRGGRKGENFFTNRASLDAKRAQQRLGLDGPLRAKRIRFRIKNDVAITGPRSAAPGKSGTPGGGREFSTLGETEIEILRVDLLRR